MLTMRATPKISEKPIASSAYTPPLTSPVTRMSWSKDSLSVLGQLEGLHALHLRRPERDFLAVLPLHSDAGDLARPPDEIVTLVELEHAGEGREADLLQHRHQLVGVGRAGLLDRGLEKHDRVVRAGVVRGRFLVAFLERPHERDRLRRELDLGEGVERRDVVAFARSGLPELVLLGLDVDAEGDRLHLALAHLPPDRD